MRIYNKEKYTVSVSSIITFTHYNIFIIILYKTAVLSNIYTVKDTITDMNVSNNKPTDLSISILPNRNNNQSLSANIPVGTKCI